ncbi:LOW QUALITY PROTEIN: LIM and calponin homology domains-containing protein 1a [Megalobrama amblycephala]|uniref:LOW QUALITY PROTEIN: LIM and calponin homology domains-containing protein 1a n=1 Tax=Megalobrama amblycephala TaxID=75352 RepID=UPI0020146DE4|nr:LOW QUALITY PROTEIN: LIM and calponin homology domains-containing protein 1a [Megalobrama amblycephala]
MASPGNDSASNAQLDQGESADATPEPAFQEAQKWIEAVTGRSFGDKDFRGGLENGILLCELLSSIKPGLVKKINRLPTPIAGLDNLTMFLRGCEELGLKGSQLFDPGDLQDTSIRANLTGSDCSRKLKNVLITIYWLGKAANSCATYNGPTLDLKEFEGLLSMMRKECVNEELDSPKRSIRDSGYIDSWESERSDSLSPPRHAREDSFDSLDSFGSRSQNTPSPDTVIRCNSDDSEGDGGHRKLPDVRKDDMSARRVSYKEPRAALPFNQYLPNKSNQTNYLPAPLRKRRSEREEDKRSLSNSTSPVGERPLREECVKVLKEGAGVSRSLALKKNFTWADEKGAELEEAELKKIRKLEKAGIKVLPATVRYNSPIENPVEANKAKPPSPDIILRRDNEFMRAAATHQWDSNEEDEDEEAEQKVPDVQKDDLASRRARMNQFKPSVAHNFLPVSCSWKDREKWEGIRLASQHAVLERMEKMEQEKKSQADSTPPEIPIITRKDNPFLNPEKERAKEGDDDDKKEVEGKIVVPNPHKDDLARRRTEGRPRPPKDPHQSLVQTSITQSDLETWQRLKMNTESSESDPTPAEVSIITRKDNPFLTPEKESGSEQENEEGTDREKVGRVVVPNVKTDDLARRRAQSGPIPQRDPRQSLAQTTITQSDLEKWQRLKMNTDSSDDPIVPLCQTCLEKGCLSVSSKTKVAKNDLAGCQERSSGERRRFVTFGGVTEMESTSWKEEEEEEEDEERGEGQGDEAEKLRYLLSMASVAVPTIGLGSRLTKRAVGSGDANPEPAPIMPPEPPNPAMFDLKQPLTSTERRVLEEELDKKAKDEREDDEEDEEEERQPDVEKDDMLARRTGAFQKPASGTTYNRFLPQPCSKREGATVASIAQKASIQMGMSGDRDFQYLERNIKTKRTKIGQRNEPVDQVPKTPVPLSEVTQKSPDIVRSSAINVDRSGGFDDDDDECGDDGHLPDFEKDDMLARRTGSHQKPSAGTGQAFNAFLPKPGSVKHKTTPVSGSQSYFKTREQETAPALDSFTLSSVAPPPRDAEDMPRKCHQMMDRQEVGSVGVVGKVLLKDETITKSPSPIPDQPSRRSLWQEDDDLPPIFRATSVSDETESVSLIDMRDEEDELAYLRAHSQSRHEHLHNQYNKLKEEEDQWQDDLARWKSRRRSASQDLIKKEEERKMMEKLMTTDGGSGHRRKSIKTYKEIVEEKERREQELHEQYCKASTPEEKAAVLQRYALRFTISDAILEKLQLPKLPSAASPMHTSPLHQPEKKPTCTALVEAKVPEPAQTTQTHHSIHEEQKTAETQAPAQPKTPEPSPAKSIKAPEVLSAPTRVPPAPSKPVPLITPKPYSQPKFSQGLRKSLKSDGLIRVNGESTQQESRERDDRDSVHRPINFSPSPPKPATQSQQNVELIVLEASDHQQNLQISVPEQEKEVLQMGKECSLISQEEDIKEDTSTALLVSEPAGKQPVPDTMTKLNCVVTTTIVTELTQTHQIPPNDMSCTEELGSVHNSCDLSSTAETITADQTSYSLSLSDGIDYSIECIETPMLNLAKRVDHWTWDPNEERRRQERWQQEQERLLQEKYQREQEKLKEEWERAQREVEEEERRHHEEEQRILEETVTPLTPRTSVLSSSSVTEAPSLTPPSAPRDTIVLSLADWDKKQEMLEKQSQTNQSNSLTHSPDQVVTPAQQNGQRTEPQESQTATPQLQFIQDGSWSCKSKGRQEDLKKTASLDRKQSPPQSQTTGMRRTGSCENVLGTHPSKSPTPSQDTPPPSPSRSVSGKKLCSSCAHPLGKGAAMIIETLGLYFHIQCFKCGVCKGLLGDTSAGTDVRIRNGLLNCQECYIKSRAAGQPTTL